VVNELHQYHKTVAECIAPIVEYSAYRKRNHSKYEMKECSSVPVTWKAVNEINRSLRYGYGLSKQDLAAILSWMHGEDLSESARKTLNLKVDGLILTYKERLSKLDSCEFDVPVAYELYPLVLQDVIKDCCSPVESIAATGQALPALRDDLETLIRREVPRVKMQVGDTLIDIASPGKAFENTRQKMVAVRQLVIRSAKSCRIDITREQLDLFSLKVLATACISVANASARTAVVIAFGKANLIQVRPSHSKHEPAHVSISAGTINIEVPSQWCLTEDSILLQSLGRDSRPIVATVDTIFKSDLDLKAEIQRRAQSLPVVKIVRCSGISMRKGHDKKDLSSKGLRRRLSRATSKLFNRKSLQANHQKDAGHHEETDGGKEKIAGIDNLGANIVDPDGDQSSEKERSIDGETPVPPPRPRRKARTKKKAEDSGKQEKLMEEAKHDPKWFSSCRKLEEPALFQVEDNNSYSVASFEELKDVIDLLSGSSTSSLSLNQQVDIDKNAKDKVSSKQNSELKKEVEGKGKVSPSDSGIGSTMSVQSHPSVTSISKFHGNDSGAIASNESNAVTISHTGVAETEQKSEIAAKVTDTSCLLKGDMICNFDEDSHIEDAEVEMFNSEARGRGENLIAERDDDETPSNGKVADFATVKSFNSEESLSQVRQEETPKENGDVPDTDQPVGYPEEEKSGKDENAERMGEGKEAEDYERTRELRSDVVAVDQDQSSYDADGSEESMESNEMEKTLHEGAFRGSNESLYYSAWTLNSDRDGPPKPDILKTDISADSYFVSSVVKSCLGDNAVDASEEFHDCREADVMPYQQSNPRFSWPVGLGDRLAAIWGEKELQSSQASASSVIWSSEKSSANDRSADNQVLYENPSSFAPRDQQFGSMNRLHNWLPKRNLPDEAYQGNLSADESFHGNPSKQNYWSGMISLAHRHKEEMHPPDWSTSGSQMHQQERGSHISSNFQKLSMSDLSSHSQPQFPSTRFWSSSPGDQQWHQTFPHFRSASFARPSSVPGTVLATHTDQPQRSINRHGMDSFERQNMDNLEHKAQSPAFQLPSSNSQSVSVTSHFISSQYQAWSSDVDSEPLLTATTRRSIAEYEALYMQQQRLQPRRQSRSASQQFKRASKW